RPARHDPAQRQGDVHLRRQGRDLRRPPVHQPDEPVPDALPRGRAVDGHRRRDREHEGRRRRRGGGAGDRHPAQSGRARALDPRRGTWASPARPRSSPARARASAARSRAGWPKRASGSPSAPALNRGSRIRPRRSAGPPAARSCRFPAICGVSTRAGASARPRVSGFVCFPADLRSLDACRSVVEQAAASLGGLDILVNNAGASAFGPFVDLPDEAFVDAINGKLLGYIRCAKAVIPYMQRRGGGVIVNITGTTQQAIPLHTPGSACNAAIRMFSKELSMELGPLNIRVNSVAPGRIQTARADRLLDATAAAQGTTPEAILSQLVQTI